MKPLDENQSPARRMYERHGVREVLREVLYVRILSDLE